ncbi:MAG TPA: GNAT family N-acetyltransferase [Candidatus Saccharimonadia bacterium]
MAGLAAIRLARPDDFADLQRLNAELFKYENDLDRRTRNLNWPSTDFAVDYFHKAAEGRDGFQGFVAEAGGRVIGYLIADCFPKLYMAEPYRVVAELENMFVEANYRRSGVGSQLVEAYKTWAVERGAPYSRPKTKRVPSPCS